MAVNFRIRGISRCRRKLVRTPTLIKKKKIKTKFYSYRICLRIQILQLITFLATLQIMYSFLGILSTDFDFHNDLMSPS